MSTETLDRLPPRQLLLPTGTRLGPVHIAVTTLERALPVWRDLVGLTVLEQTAQQAVLGAGDTPLIVLEAGAARPVVPKSLGLYHVAIHVPTRRDLARAIARLAAVSFRQSPTDHLVTETTYLWDADGNGIELTFETPWRGHFDETSDALRFVTTDGRPHSGLERVDLDSMFAELKEGEDLSQPLPAGTRIGHVHLHARDLVGSMQFYAGVVGFRRQMLSTNFGMGDVRTDYEPHILAFNIWSGPAATQAPPDAAGLRHFTVVVPDADGRAALEARLAEAGHRPEGGFYADPSGNRFRVVPSE